jgi:xanthine/uracil/vitamin C permease (AzgA family)
MGTMTGLSRESGLADPKGDFPRLRSALIVEGVGAVAGGFTSSSSNTGGARRLAAIDMRRTDAAASVASPPRG